MANTKTNIFSYGITSRIASIYLVLMLSTLLSIMAQPRFASIYEDYIKGGSGGDGGGDDERYDCQSQFTKDCCRTTTAAYYMGRIWDALAYFATTLEVLVRGFSLGFGVRMLKYIFFSEENEGTGEDVDLIKCFKRRAIVSAISGLSVAAFIHGSSLFIPTQVREQWFNFE